MKTNYQKLDKFEISAVALASIGVFLFSVIAYNGLDERQQKNVASAFEMFDIHEQVMDQRVALHNVMFVAPQIVLDEFYLAFSEAMHMTDETYSWWQTFGQQTQIAINTTLNFSDQVAIAFHRTVETNTSYLLPDQGQVAGASVFVESPPEIEQVLENILPKSPPGFKPPADPRSYKGYTPPTLPDDIRSLIKF